MLIKNHLAIWIFLKLQLQRHLSLGLGDCTRRFRIFLLNMKDFTFINWSHNILCFLS